MSALWLVLVHAEAAQHIVKRVHKPEAALNGGVDSGRVGGGGFGGGGGGPGWRHEGWSAY